MALTKEQETLIALNAPRTAANPPFAAASTPSATKPAQQPAAQQSTQTQQPKQTSGLTAEQIALIAQNAPRGAQTTTKQQTSTTAQQPAKAQQPENTPSFFERLFKTAAGGGKQYVAGKVNAAGVAAEGQKGTAMSAVYRAQAETLDKQIAALEATLKDPTMTAKDITETREALRIAREQRAQYGDVIRSGENTAGEVYKIADEIADSSAKDIARAKEGTGFVGGLLVDAGSQMTQMALDALTARALGIGSVNAKTGKFVPNGLPAMATRTFGSSAQEARQSGADLQQAVNYAMPAAAVEVLTEKMFDGLAGLYGKGAADEIVERVINRMTSDPAARRALSVAAAGGGEALEEAVSGIVNPFLKTAYNGKDLGGAFKEAFSKEHMADTLYDALVGGLMGGIGGTVQQVADARADAQAQETLPVAAGARNTSEAGQITPAETERVAGQETGNTAQQTAQNETAAASDETTAVNVNPAGHTAAEQAVIEEYKNAVDPSLLDWIKRVRTAISSGDKSAKKMRTVFGAVAPKTAIAVQDQTGIDVSGFEHMIDGNAASHDEIRHGKGGEADASMENPEDLARVKYVLDNFDTCELSKRKDGTARTSHQFRDKNNRPAPKVLFTKKVNGTYYVVEAVADSADKKLHVISAYMSNKNASGGVNQELNMENVSPQLTPEAQLDPVASAQSDTTIPQPSNVVNTSPRTVEVDTVHMANGRERFIPVYVDGNLRTPVTPGRVYATEAAARAAADAITAPDVTPSNVVDTGAGAAYNQSTTAERSATNGAEAELHGAAGEGLPGQNVTAVGGVLESRGQDGRGDLQSAGGAYLKQSAVDAITQQGLAFVPVAETQDKAAYSALLDEARANDPKNGWAVTPKTAEKLANTRTYLSEDGGIGFAVSQDGDLEAVFRNKGRETPRHSMQSVLPQAIAAGAIKGDCYGEDLVHVYEAGGAFRPVARVEFNPEYANDGWTPDKGTPYIYFFMATDTDANRVAEGQGQHHLSTQAELDALPTFDKDGYDDAAAYRDRLLEQQGITSRPVNPGDYGNATGAAQAGFSVPHGQQVPTQNKTITDGVILTEKEARQFPPETHERVTEPMSMMRAGENFYADENGNVTNLDETVRTLLEKETWTGADQDTAQLAMAQLVKEARQSGNWDKVRELKAAIEKIGGTEIGRSLQARQKWINSATDIVTRAMTVMDNAGQYDATPEVMSTVSEMAFDFEEAMDAGNWDDIADIIRRTSKVRKTGNFFTNEWSKRMNTALDNVVERAKNGDTRAQSFLEHHAAHGLVAIAEDYDPVTFSNGLLAIRRAAMLDKISTTMRNFVSNNIFDPMDSVSNNIATLLDMALSKTTGTRSTAWDRSWASEAKRRGSMEALDMAILETGLDVDATGDQGKYERGGSRTYKMRGGTMARLLSTWEKHLGYRLYATDQFQKGGIEAEIQRGMDELYRKGLITDPSVKDAAPTEALYRTFQDSTALSRLSIDARRALNNISVAGVGLGDVAIPFAQVPANLASRAVEYSPLGIANGVRKLGQLFAAQHNGTLTAQMQRDAVKTIGRGLNGTALIAAAATMALKGLLHVADVGGDEDKDKRALEKQSGINGTQINLSALERWFKGESTEWRDGDVLHSIGYLDPMNAMLTTGALIAQDVETGEDVGALDVLKDSFEGTLQSVLDIPVMNTLKEAAQAYNYSTATTLGGKIGEALEEYAAGQVSSVIPNSLKGIAQGTDKYQRDAYTADNVVGETWDAIRASIPGLRETLPAKQNSYGEDWENPDMLLNFINANLSPGAYNRYQRPQQKVTQELDRISDATKDDTVYPSRKAPNSVTFDGEKYELTAEEKRKFQQTAGAEFLRFANAIIGGKSYAKLSDADKAEAFSDAASYATAKARQEYLKGKGETYTLSGDARTIEKAMDATGSKIDPSEFFVYKIVHDEINDDKTLSAAEKATKFAVYLNDQKGLTDAKRDKLIELLPYSAGFSAQASKDALSAVNSGIDLDVWNEYHRATSAMTADKDASGNAIAGSKKAKVVAYINSMDISIAQKDRLYLDAGYSEKDLPAMPWHK